METTDLLPIDEAAARIGNRLGMPFSAAKLRKMRSTWPAGECLGPQPLLLSTRRLRYRAEHCDEFADETLKAAEQATERPTETG